MSIENLEFKKSSGVIYMIIAVTFLAIQQVMVKMLPEIPVHEIVFFRALISFLISASVIAKTSQNFKGQNYVLLTVRGVVGTLSLLTFFYSLQHIPLATAVTIGHLSPIFLGILAVLFLNERITPIQWVGIAISFSGIILIKGFDMRISALDLGIAVFSALLTAVAHFTVRLLKSESPITVLFYFSMIMMVVLIPFLIYQWKTPTFSQLTFLILLSVVSHYAQLFLTKALKAEEIGQLNSIYYLGIALSVLTGLLIFNETFNLETVLGMSLIVAGVLTGVYYKSKVAKEI